jgi:hypothetical protein
MISLLQEMRNAQLSQGWRTNLPGEWSFGNSLAQMTSRCPTAVLPWSGGRTEEAFDLDAA